MYVKYDSERTRAFFEGYGAIDTAWDDDPLNRVSFHIHCRYLRRYVKPGDRVLDAGAGVGRYTIELAKLGAKVTTSDISPHQLEINRRNVFEARQERNVVAFEVADIVSMPQFSTASFDSVVCYGGPLSYACDRADDALEELLRVTKPGGYVLISVGSSLGTTRTSLRQVLKHAERHGSQALRPGFTIGEKDGEISEGSNCHLYSWAELESLLKKRSCEIVAASADYFLSSREALDEIAGRPDIWEAFLRWETYLCREPGVRDAGRSIIAVVRRFQSAD